MKCIFLPVASPDIVGEPFSSPTATHSICSPLNFISNRNPCNKPSYKYSVRACFSSKIEATQSRFYSPRRRNFNFISGLIRQINICRSFNCNHTITTIIVGSNAIHPASKLRITIKHLPLTHSKGYQTCITRYR